jgi:hypothetical protein
VPGVGIQPAIRTANGTVLLGARADGAAKTTPVANVATVTANGRQHAYAGAGSLRRPQPPGACPRSRPTPTASC